MENLNVKIEGDQKTLEVRTGEALPLKEPKKVVITGDINTISQYLRKRKGDLGHSTQGVFNDKAIIYTDRERGLISIAVDPENPYGATVQGSLEKSKELEQFKINSQTTFNREQLVKILKFSKRHFDSPEVHSDIFAAYSAFRATSKTDHESSSDSRGNKAKVFTKEVQSNLPQTFVLNMPIFKGQPNERFMVEICLELTDAGAHFWFESVELEELIAVRTDEIFEKQLAPFREMVIVNI